MSYFKEFIDAIERTKSWGLDPGDITLDKSIKYLNKDTGTHLLKMLEREYHDSDESDLLECTKVSFNMLKLVQNYFNTDAYLTTGNLKNNNVLSFDCSIDYLQTFP